MVYAPRSEDGGVAVDVRTNRWVVDHKAGCVDRIAGWKGRSLKWCDHLSWCGATPMTGSGWVALAGVFLNADVDMFAYCACVVSKRWKLLEDDIVSLGLARYHMVA